MSLTISLSKWISEKGGRPVSAPDDEFSDSAAAPGAQPPSVLGKAHLLLSAFDTTHPCLGLTELSRRSGVPKASVYRLARELVALGLLDRVHDHYQLGWRVYELGQQVPGPATLRGVARPILMDLHSATKAVVHLSVPQGNDTLHLERIGGRRDTRVHGSLGMRVPLWFSASGKLFLAYSEQPDPLLDDFRRGVTPLTRHSTVALDALRDQMTKTRERRWAAECEECVVGYKTYAVPLVAGAQSKVVAALSATIDVGRQDDQRVIQALWAAATDVTRMLRRSPAATWSSETYAGGQHSLVS